MQNVMQALYLTRNARGLPASARRYNTPKTAAFRYISAKYYELYLYFDGKRELGIALLSLF